MSATVLAAELGTTDVWMAVAIVALTLLSVFTAMAETSLLRISKAKAKSLVEEGKPGAVALQELVESPERWLNALLLVVLVSQIVQASLTGVLAGNLFGAKGVIIGVALNVSVMYVLAETAPKTPWQGRGAGLHGAKECVFGTQRVVTSRRGC